MKYRIKSRLEKESPMSDNMVEVFDIEEKYSLFSWIPCSHYVGFRDFDMAKSSLLKIMVRENNKESFKSRIWKPTKLDLTMEKLK